MLAHARAAALLGTAWVIAAASCGADAFACAGAEACGAGGQCEDVGYCSFPDDTCPSGRRYGAHAGGGLASVCVPPGPPSDGSGDAGEGSTSGPGGPALTSASVSDGMGDDTLALTSGPTSSAGSSGALDDATTPAASTSDDATYEDDGTTGAPIERVTDGLLVLYRFDEGAGDIVFDQSGVAPAVDLTIQPESGSPAWATDGLAFTGGGIALALGSATKVRMGCQATSELSVEAWITPSSLDQTGPTRIATLSLDITARSFTLGQDLDPAATASWVARLRTTSSTVNGTPGFYAPGPVGTDTAHVLFSRAPDGTLRIWADGELVLTDTRAGDFSGWPETDQLAVGNEIDLLRPYLGVVHLVAVYDRALSPDEVAQNFAAGY